MNIPSSWMVKNGSLPRPALTFSGRSAASRCFFLSIAEQNSKLKSSAQLHIKNFILILTEPKSCLCLLRMALGEDFILKYYVQIFEFCYFLSICVCLLLMTIQDKRISSLGQAWAFSSHQRSLALLSVLQAKEFRSFLVELRSEAVLCPRGGSLHCGFCST